jgi:hypothetical protein
MQANWPGELAGVVRINGRNRGVRASAHIELEAVEAQALLDVLLVDVNRVCGDALLLGCLSSRRSRSLRSWLSERKSSVCSRSDGC